jgi:hypothetical protein
MLLPADEVLRNKSIADGWKVILHPLERHVGMFRDDRIIRKVVHALDLAYLSRGFPFPVISLLVQAPERAIKMFSSWIDKAAQVALRYIVVAAVSGGLRHLKSCESSLQGGLNSRISRGDDGRACALPVYLEYGNKAAPDDGMTVGLRPDRSEELIRAYSHELSTIVRLAEKPTGSHYP